MTGIETALIVSSIAGAAASTAGAIISSQRSKPQPIADPPATDASKQAQAQKKLETRSLTASVARSQKRGRSQLTAPGLNIGAFRAA